MAIKVVKRKRWILDADQVMLLLELVGNLDPNRYSYNETKALIYTLKDINSVRPAKYTINAFPEGLEIVRH